jgi:hypothetical protein
MVSFGSIGSGILAAASAADHDFALTASISSLIPHAYTPVYFELRVDAKSLYDTLTTLYESNNYRLRPTVARLRDSFGAKKNTRPPLYSWSIKFGRLSQQRELCRISHAQSSYVGWPFPSSVYLLSC